jgi:hypothetical protein
VFVSWSIATENSRVAFIDIRGALPMRGDLGGGTEPAGRTAGIPTFEDIVYRNSLLIWHLIAHLLPIIW